MLKTSRHILAPSGAAESSPAGTAGSATLRRTVPAGTADEQQFQSSLSGLWDMPQLARQSLPGYSHSRLAALGILPVLCSAQGARSRQRSKRGENTRNNQPGANPNHQLLIASRFYMPRPDGQRRVNLLWIVLVEIYILDRANASRIGHGSNKSGSAVSRREFVNGGAVVKVVSSHHACLARRHGLVGRIAPAVPGMERTLELNMIRLWVDNAVFSHSKKRASISCDGCLRQLICPRAERGLLIPPDLPFIRRYLLPGGFLHRVEPPVAHGQRIVAPLFSAARVRGLG